ncbi:hypothetical protein BS17DRAFT_830706 [Gyrodon lividus]|nr:hypothetical protein BS17DRAFT_830706 [Gyrodon lividus]
MKFDNFSPDQHMTFLTASGFPAPMFDILTEAVKKHMNQLQGTDHMRSMFDAAVGYSSMLIANSRTSEQRCFARLALAAALLARSSCGGSNSPLDFDRAIECYKTVLLDLPPRHPYRSNVHCQLVIACKARPSQSNHASTRQDLDLVIEHCSAALEFCTLGHPDHACITVTLGNELRERYTLYGDMADLQRAITLFHEALECPPAGQPRYRLLSNLAWSLLSRFEMQGNQSDSEAAIQHHCSALATLSDDHPDRAEASKNLSESYLARYNHYGRLPDLQIAIGHLRSALAAATTTHPTRTSILTSLADALLLRFKVGNRGSDLEQPVVHLSKVDLALEKYRIAAQICPRENPKCLLDLAVALCRQFLDLGDSNSGSTSSSLDCAVQSYNDALAMLPPKSTYRQDAVMTLGAALSRRYQDKGDQEDLDRSISLYKDALSCCPSHIRNHDILCNLATALMLRFEYLGQLSDLDHSIEKYFAAYEGYPEHPQRHELFSNLSNALIMRYTHQGNPVDIDLAIQCSGQSLKEAGEGSLIHLHLAAAHARALLSRFHISQNKEDLDLAISIFDQGRTSTPKGQWLHLVFAINLADALVVQFNALGGTETLDRAIDIYQWSRSEIHSDHPKCTGVLVHFARALLLRHSLGQSTTDLDDVFDVLQTAKDKSQPGYHNYVYEHFTWAQHERWKLSRNSGDLQQMFEYCERAVANTDGGPWPLLKASLRWAWNAHKKEHPSALMAYRASLDLLDRHTLVASSLAQRHEVVKAIQRVPTLAADAASWAICHGKLELAVEFLEQGRGLLWAQLSQLRLPLDHLRSLNEHALCLADRFERLSRQLEAYSTQPLDPSPSLSSESTHYRRISHEWTSVITSIREIDGFEDFLRPTPFERLCVAACEGPVIMINASQFSCDAIIVFESKQPVHVPLPLSLSAVVKLSSILDFIMRPTTLGHGEGNNSKDNNIVFPLRQIWADIVSPVVEALRSQSDPLPLGSRIWGCATSKATFLPLHAAGAYRKGQENLAHLFVSSYTPTLAALIRSRRERLPSSTPAFLAIGQANPHEGIAHTQLDCVENEIVLVRDKVSPHMAHETLTGASATAEHALSSLARHSWVHLACHGKQDLAQPFNSHFSMRGSPLFLKDIIRNRYEHHEFAFLSACHTAAGDRSTPDEAIHLAAGMQFSGFRSVIGTMWALDDSSANEIEWTAGMLLGL